MRPWSRRSSVWVSVVGVGLLLGLASPAGWAAPDEEVAFVDPAVAVDAGVADVPASVPDVVDEPPGRASSTAAGTVAAVGWGGSAALVGVGVGGMMVAAALPPTAGLLLGAGLVFFAPCATTVVSVGLLAAQGVLTHQTFGWDGVWAAAPTAGLGGLIVGGLGAMLGVGLGLLTAGIMWTKDPATVGTMAVVGASVVGIPAALFGAAVGAPIGVGLHAIQTGE